MTKKFEESRLHEIETVWNEAFKGHERFEFRSAKQSVVKDLPRDPGGTRETRTSIFYYHVDTITGQDVESNGLPLSSGAMFARFNSIKGKGLFRGWDTWKDFLDDLLASVIAWQKESADKKSSKTSKHSQACKALIAGTPRREVFSDFCTSPKFLTMSVSNADREFLYSHLRQDRSKQLYWVFNDNSVVPIPLTQRIGEQKSIALDANAFWEHFWIDNTETIRRYVDAATSICNQYSETHKLEEMSDEIPDPEDDIMAVVPQVFLRCVKLGTTQIKIDKMWCLEGFSIAPRTGIYSWAPDDCQKTFAESFIKSAYLHTNEIQEIGVFSNDPGKAIHYIDVTQVDRSSVPKVLPTLPPEWHKFLRGKDGKRPKFPSQEMGELRLATFLRGLFDVGDRSRQILVAIGQGMDGKSVMFQAVRGLLRTPNGEDLGMDGLSEDAFEEQFGLQSVINKRLLVVDDIKKPGSFMNNSIVKKITGAGSGTVQIDIKYQAPYAWDVSGCKLVMSTNNGFSLYDEAAITRCLPLCFMQNFDQKDAESPHLLTAKLVSEKREIIQWAFDMVAYYRNLRNVNGEEFPCFHDNNIDVLTDQEFVGWYNGTYDLVPKCDNLQMQKKLYRERRRAAFETETTIDRREPFIKVLQDKDVAEDQEVYAGDIITSLFEFDATYCMRRSDIAHRLIDLTSQSKHDNKADEAVCMLIKTAGMDCRSADSLCKSAAYRAFMKQLIERPGVEVVSKRLGAEAVKCIVGCRFRTSTKPIEPPKFDGYNTDQTAMTDGFLVPYNEDENTPF